MLQPSLSLQIEFHTSNLFQMLLSVAACQFCLPLTQCLHKVFSPHSTGQAALFSNSIALVGTSLHGAPGGEILNKLCFHIFVSVIRICYFFGGIYNNLIYSTPDSFQFLCTHDTPHSQLLFPLSGDSLHYTAWHFLCS